MSEPVADGAAADARPELSLRFDARLDLVEGILAVAQDWAARKGIPRDDGLSMRLVLEELIVNICLHADAAAKGGRVLLQLERLPSRTGRPGLVRITLRDAGRPFNPLSFSAEPVAGIADTPVGGRGLTLVHLITTDASYRRAGGENILCVDLPLDGRIRSTAGSWSATEPELPPYGLCNRLRGLWSGSLALRQTALFTLCSVVLIWGAMALYLVSVGRERSEAVTALAAQAMISQSGISSNFVDRVGGTVDQLADSLRATPDLRQPVTDADALVERLRNSSELRSLIAEIPVVGLIVGHGGRTWLYHPDGGSLHGKAIDADLAPFVAPAGEPPRWQGVHMPFEGSGPHAVMLYGVPLFSSGPVADGWIGTIITMPWIADALQFIGGFRDSVPFFVDQGGRYMIHPVGRQSGDGPQSLSDEARQFDAPGLAEVERRILAGEKGVVQLRHVLGGDPTPWPLPWSGPTSMAYHPMAIPGWYLGLMISSDELGDAPQDLPFEFYLMAVLGPLAIGCVTWYVTSRTLRPVHHLAAALKRFGDGDMEAPFPVALYPDEIGSMLTTFERVRATLRASFRNLATSAATQERIFSELALARDIQTSMLPAVFPRLPWAAVHASIDMCSEVCGDLHDCFLPRPDAPSRLCCVIGDVCGKGVPAALVMSRAISLARAFLMEGLTPGETLSRINDALLRGNNSMMFVTMLAGILDEDGIFTWSSAGHPPPLVALRPDRDDATGADHQALPWSGDLVLGVRGGERYSTFHHRLRPGESLLLYTDGADEALAPPPAGGPPGGKPELYGEARLARSFADACRSPDTPVPEEIVARISADLAAHMAGRPAADDISLMVVTYGASGAAGRGEPAAAAGHSSAGTTVDSRPPSPSPSPAKTVSSRMSP